MAAIGENLHRIKRIGTILQGRQRGGDRDARTGEPQGRCTSLFGSVALGLSERSLWSGQIRPGVTWRLVSDEGPYLNGHDAAPCPLAFLSVGMAGPAS